MGCSIDFEIGRVFINQLWYKVYYDTTENWNAKRTFIGERGSIYIYSDAESIDDGEGGTTPVPGIKVADGNAYLIDQPFVDAALRNMLIDHINDRIVHITQQEREFWNSKVKAEVADGTEMLVLYETASLPDWIDG